jgi:phosphatidylserine decarboxylase
VRFAPEGWLFVIPVILLAAIALLLQWYAVAIVLGALGALLLHFFRDPHRAGSERHVDVLAPADGTVVQIKDIPDGEVWPGLTKQISILMSIFDVHVNRAPISGRIVHTRREPEQNLVVITDARGVTVAFKQIAGLVARRIVFDRKEGDEVGRGERVGMIKFGSRVDAFFPAEANIKVRMRDKVKVALTVIAEIGS